MLQVCVSYIADHCRARSLTRGRRMAGFTLVETVLYIAIFSGMVTALVSFALSITESRNKTYVVQEVQANMRVAHDIVSQRIRSASAVNASSSVFGTDPGVLSLAMASSSLNPTIITLSADDGVLQIKEGNSVTTTITSSDVQVHNLVFHYMTDASLRKNLRMFLTVRFNNPGDDPVFNHSQTVTTSISVRQ